MTLETKINTDQLRMWWRWIKDENYGMCWCGSDLAAERRNPRGKGWTIGCKRCTPNDQEQFEALRIQMKD